MSSFPTGRGKPPAARRLRIAPGRTSPRLPGKTAAATPTSAAPRSLPAEPESRPAAPTKRPRRGPKRRSPGLKRPRRPPAQKRRPPRPPKPPKRIGWSSLNRIERKRAFLTPLPTVPRPSRRRRPRQRQRVPRRCRRKRRSGSPASLPTGGKLPAIRPSAVRKSSGGPSRRSKIRSFAAPDRTPDGAAAQPPGTRRVCGPLRTGSPRIPPSWCCQPLTPRPSARPRRIPRWRKFSPRWGSGPPRPPRTTPPS